MYTEKLLPLYPKWHVGGWKDRIWFGASLSLFQECLILCCQNHHYEVTDTQSQRRSSFLYENQSPDWPRITAHLKMGGATLISHSTWDNDKMMRTFP